MSPAPTMPTRRDGLRERRGRGRRRASCRPETSPNAYTRARISSLMIRSASASSSAANAASRDRRCARRRPGRARGTAPGASRDDRVEALAGAPRRRRPTPRRSRARGARRRPRRRTTRAAQRDRTPRGSRRGPARRPSGRARWPRPRANGLLAAGRVRMTSSAFSIPTRRGTRYAPPQPGTRPRPVSGQREGADVGRDRAVVAVAARARGRRRGRRR